MFNDLSFADILFIILVGGIIYGFVSLAGLGRKKKSPTPEDEE